MMIFTCHSCMAFSRFIFDVCLKWILFNWLGGAWISKRKRKQSYTSKTTWASHSIKCKHRNKTYVNESTKLNRYELTIPKNIDISNASVQLYFVVILFLKSVRKMKSILSETTCTRWAHKARWLIKHKPNKYQPLLAHINSHCTHSSKYRFDRYRNMCISTIVRVDPNRGWYKCECFMMKHWYMSEDI